MIYPRAHVGGGSGGLALSLHTIYPHLKINVAELPSQVPVARTLLDEAGGESIYVHGCDIVESPLSLCYDIAILRAVLQVMPPAYAEKTIRNVALFLNPGGCIIIMHAPLLSIHKNQLIH